MSTCRNCGQKIKWIQNSKGKNIPCDPEPTNIIDIDDGLFALDAETKRVIRVDSSRYDNSNNSSRWYVSHWSTCPKQEQSDA